ncbi:MAG: twin-arginine translocase subunit TatC [Kiritimatiellales bacterium]|nr:twin-arginine translocase subunit TatC [Kiritimatiellales bacterium]
MLEKLKSLKNKFVYNDSEMPFLDHLEDFRKTVIRSFIAIIAGMLICLPFADRLISVLRAPAEPYIEKSAEEAIQGSTFELRIPVMTSTNGVDSLQTVLNDAVLVETELGSYYVLPADVQVAEKKKSSKTGVIRLQFSEPSAAIKMWLMVAFCGGMLLSLPALIFIIGSFIMPGVKDIERSVMSRISGFSAILFFTGVAMGYKITLPLALGLMLKIGGRLGGESIWFYNKYIGFAIQLLLGFGVAFQLPVVILLLGKMGLVNSRQLREKRRHVIVGLLILAMILTPPDIMTQLLMAAPLIFLYEFCIWFLFFTGTRDEYKDTETVTDPGDDGPENPKDGDKSAESESSAESEDLKQNQTAEELDECGMEAENDVTVDTEDENKNLTEE